LCLYNAASGERVRRLIGHEGAIYSVSFSGDGKLLVSSAEDQTICVWSITSLDKILGKKGQIVGFAADEKNGSILISKIDPAGPASGELDEGDIVESMQVGPSSRPVKNLA